MYRVAVADLGSPSYFVATAAVTLGFFAAEGIDVEPVIGGTKAEQNTRGLNDGSFHFFGGPAYGPLKSFPDFKGVRILCALSQFSYWFMGIRADLDIPRGDLKALRGLRIASSQSSPGRGLRHMLAMAGLDPLRDQISIVRNPSAGHQRVYRAHDGLIAIRDGHADAFWGNGLRLEVAVRAGVAKLHVDLRRGDGPAGARFHNFPALCASEDFVAAHPDVAEKAVRAIVRTQAALGADPSLAAQVGRTIFPPNEASMIADVVARDVPFYQAAVSQEAIDGLNQFCLSAGLMNAAVSYDDLVETRMRPLWELDGEPYGQD